MNGWIIFSLMIAGFFLVNILARFLIPLYWQKIQRERARIEYLKTPEYQKQKAEKNKEVDVNAGKL